MILTSKYKNDNVQEELIRRKNCMIFQNWKITAKESTDKIQGVKISTTRRLILFLNQRIIHDQTSADLKY